MDYQQWAVGCFFSQVQQSQPSFFIILGLYDLNGPVGIKLDGAALIAGELLLVGVAMLGEH